VNVLLLQSNGFCLAGTPIRGIQITTGGDIWYERNYGIPPGIGGKREVYSFLELEFTKVLCGVNDKIYLSTDFGSTWNESSTGYNADTPNRIMRGPDGKIYAAANYPGGVYRSSDNSSTWVHIGVDNTVYSLGWDINAKLCRRNIDGGTFQVRV